MVRKTVKASGVTWRYSYTGYDELSSASRHSSADPASPALEKVTYVFDALGRRIAERRFDAANALTGGMNFHYDGEEAAHEADLSAAGAVTGQRWTTHSDGVDGLLAVTLPVGSAGTVSPTATTSGPAAPSNASFYYHTDHQGSVRAITAQNGAVTNSYAYDSYGTAQESVESLAQRFRYTGREFDALTGRYHYRARAFDPQTARFLQEDPLWFGAGDLNVYRMTWNNPVNWTGPSGMSAGIEQRALYGIGLAVGAALTLNAAYELKLHLKVRDAILNSPTYQVVRLVVTIQNQGLGCLIGAQLSGRLGASIAGASSATAGPNGCAVVWNTADGESPEPNGGASDPIGGLVGGKPYEGETGNGTKVYGGTGGTKGREGDFGGIPGEEIDKGKGVRVKELADGTKVISRPGDSRPGENGGTIEVQRPGTGPSWIKVRY